MKKLLLCVLTCVLYGQTAFATPFIEAAKMGDIAQLSSILKNEKHINQIDREGYTALITAIRYGQEAAVDFLIKNKAKIDQKDTNNEMTPLMWAVASNNLNMVKKLVEHGAYIHAIDLDGHTALTTAGLKNLTDIIEYLESKGATWSEIAPDVDEEDMY